MCGECSNSLRTRQSANAPPFCKAWLFLPSAPAKFVNSRSVLSISISRRRLWVSHHSLSHAKAAASHCAGVNASSRAISASISRVGKSWRSSASANAPITLTHSSAGVVTVYCSSGKRSAIHDVANSISSSIPSATRCNRVDLPIPRCPVIKRCWGAALFGALRKACKIVANSDWRATKMARSSSALHKWGLYLAAAAIPRPSPKFAWVGLMMGSDMITRPKVTQ